MQLKHWISIVVFTLCAITVRADEWIRINQLGYLPESKKVAVFLSEVFTYRSLHWKNGIYIYIHPANRYTWEYEKHISNRFQ